VRLLAHSPSKWVLIWWYRSHMADPTRLSSANIEAARKRRLAAMGLQEIEGNPLSPADVALFEMFEREAWTHERRRAHLLALAAPLAAE
jgi:hypothetical protein